MAREDPSLRDSSHDLDLQSFGVLGSPRNQGWAVFRAMDYTV